MKRPEVVLTAMVAGGAGAQFDPVRVQKLLFLVDKDIPQFVEGPHFGFKPYNYGPFDVAVFQELDALSMENEVCVNHNGYRLYSLTDSGHARGAAMLAELPQEIARYLKDAAQWVLSQTFRQLLVAIYQCYPDMAVNSIVPYAASSHFRTSYLLPTPSFLSGMARTLDFMGTLDDRPIGAEEKQIDALAIRKDWLATGCDLEDAMAQAKLSGNFQ